MCAFNNAKAANRCSSGFALALLDACAKRGSCSYDIHDGCEVYMVRKGVWAKAGVKPLGGCLCIGCLERRIGRRLKPKDFPDNPLNWLPGTLRLMNRQGRSA